MMTFVLAYTFLKIRSKNQQKNQRMKKQLIVKVQHRVANNNDF